MIEKIQIIETMPGKTNFSLFEDTVQEMYPENSIRLLQGTRLHHRYLQNCFVAMHHKKPVGRAALYINPSHKLKGKKIAAIGNYESIDNSEVYLKLLTTVESYAKKMQIPQIIGPMDGSTWENYRFKTNPVPSFFLEPEHPIFYNTHFEDFGFSELARYHSYLFKQPGPPTSNLSEIKQKMEKAAICIRPIRLHELDKDLKKIHTQSHESFKDNFLFTPEDGDVFLNKYLSFKEIINPEQVLLAEDKSGKIFGFIFAIDNLYFKHEKSLVIKTVAITPNKAYAGLGIVLINEIMQYAWKNKYDSVIHAFIIEPSASNNYSSKNSTLYQSYKLYQKSIEL